MQTIVNTVNTVGFMGAGIALEYKRRFPEMITDIPVLISKTLQLYKKK